MSYAEIKALAAGNPLIVEKTELDTQVAKLKLLKQNYLSQIYRLEDLIAKYYPVEIKKIQDIIKGIENDIVVVEKREYADNGEIVVAMIDDEATVKRFFKENGKYRLQPENSALQPIYTDEVSILGKVVASVRYY